MLELVFEDVKCALNHFCEGILKLKSYFRGFSGKFVTFSLFLWVFLNSFNNFIISNHPKAFQAFKPQSSYLPTTSTIAFPTPFTSTSFQNTRDAKNRYISHTDKHQFWWKVKIIFKVSTSGKQKIIFRKFTN